MRLTWIDNAANETQFSVERKAEDGPWTFRFRTAADAELATDGGLTPGATYLYRVRAVNASGASALSNTDAVTLPGPPPAPTNLSVRVLSSRHVQLTWTDNSRDELYFYIYRRVGTGPYQFRLRVGRNETTAEDAGLQPNSTYTYRVRAWNGEFYSRYSNEETVTTPR